MATRSLVVFEHDNELGKAPSHELFEAVTVQRRDGVEVARDFDDYEVVLADSVIPDGVTVHRRI